MRKLAISAAFVFFVSALLLFGCSNQGGAPPSSDIACSRIMSSDASVVTLEHAKTPGEQALGLSNRDSLCKTCGMLFTFNTSARYQFWMKDMRFPLDIVFLDKDFRVVYVERNAQPCPAQGQGECPLITPPSPIKYALEVNAGYASEHSLAPNSMLICIP